MAGEDYGKHLQASEDMLVQHNLHEAQLHALTQRARKLTRRSQASLQQAPSLDKRLDALNSELSK